MDYRLSPAKAAWLLLLPGVCSSSVHASGFALIEQSASGTGNAFAGAAAAPEDAATVYFNPAGMMALPRGRQLSVAGHYINPSARFQNGSSTGATLFGAPSTNTTTVDGGVNAIVPNAYFVTEWRDFRAGIGINSPFGLSTSYPSDWLGRFQGVRSELMTINVNPALAWQANDRLALGAGLNYQRLDAEFTSKSNYAAALFNGVIAGGGTVAAATAAAAGIAAAGQAEGTTTLKGKDGGWGWNAGLQWKAGEHTMVGVTYRSRVKYTLEGSVRFENRPAALAASAPDGNIKLDVSMPDSFSMALSHQMSDRLQWLLDITWTGWNVLNRFEAVRTNNIPASGAVLQSIPYNWHNTWRAGLGANYRMNDAWILKAGVAIDQSPTNNNDRGVRLPDADRTWLAVGAKYRLGPASAIDLGYAHVFVRGASINSNAGGVNQTSTAAFALVSGSYASSVDILSAQYSLNF